MVELETLLKEVDLAALRGVTVRTLQRERAERRGPPFVKMGRAVFYRPEAVNAWLRAIEKTPVRSELREGRA